MKSLAHFVTLLVTILFGTAVGAVPCGTPYPPGRDAQGVEDDHVYTYGEVDIKAKIISSTPPPQVGEDCPRRGLVRLRLILHKSGRVTEVTVMKDLGCSFDESAVESARELKFVPASKGGRNVSQYQVFEYRYEK